jgi:hypothetical protein
VLIGVANLLQNDLAKRLRALFHCAICFSVASPKNYLLERSKMFMPDGVVSLTEKPVPWLHIDLLFLSRLDVSLDVHIKFPLIEKMPQHLDPSKRRILFRFGR